MSSHHIVRDEQEPAIVITEMKKPYWSVITQLLGWIPTVIVAQECIDEVISMGIKVDVVICDEEDQVSLKEKLSDQQPLKFIIRQKQHELTLAVDYLCKKGYKGVNIFGQFDAEKSLVINKDIIAIWYDTKYRYLLSKHGQFQKWMVGNHSFSVLGTLHNQSFDTINADKSANEDVFTCATDGKVIVNSSDEFWIGEPY